MRRRALVGVMALGISSLLAGATTRSQSSGHDRLRSLARESLSQIAGELRMPGLRADVRV